MTTAFTPGAARSRSVRVSSSVRNGNTPSLSSPWIGGIHALLPVASSSVSYGVIDPSLRNRRRAGTSQLPMELLLTAYAVVAAIILLRTLLVAMEVTDRIWIGAFIYGMTDHVTVLLDRLPGATTPIMWNLSVSDLTLLAPVVLFPLGLIALGDHDR